MANLTYTGDIPANRSLGRTPLVQRYAAVLEEIRAHPSVWATEDGSPLFAPKGIYRRAGALNKREEKDGKWEATVYEEKGYLRWIPE